MPCYTDPPSDEELTEARLRELCNEIDGKKFNHKSQSVYGNGSKVQEYTRKLCAFLKDLRPADIKRYSLELQIWWRDHQEEDARHERESLERKQRKAIEAQALSKLTKLEKKVLGLD